MSLDFLGRAPSWFAVIVALAGGCVSEIGDDRDRTEAADDPLIGGVVDYGQPEVGYLTGSGCGVAGCLHGCTATLVSTNVVLSAAHCVDFLTLGALPSGQYGQFVLESAER